MKKLLSKVMAVVFVFTMLFALPTQRISAAENVDYNDALNTTIQKYIEKFQNGFSSNITWDSWAIIGLARSDKEVPKEIFDTYYSKVEAFVQDKISNNQKMSGGDLANSWAIIGLARSDKEVPKEIFDTYYSKVEAFVQDKISNNQKMSGGDLAKLILSVSAIGQDPRNVAGNDLIDIVWHQDGILNEYYTSLAYVLIAVDSKNYQEPKDALNTRDKMIEALLSNELDNGGFGWGTPEPDSTAMVLQALVKHQDREDVKNTMNRSLVILSELQTETGGYVSWGNENSNSVAQVITLLTALGENPTTSEAFLKGENNLLGNLITFYTGNGDFKYIHSDSGANGMATEQALYSLASYDRLVNGKTSLYDMTDVISTTDYLNIVKEVNSRIETLPGIEAISLDNKEEVNSILAKFNSLPEEYKVQVIGESKLNSASSKIAEIQNTIDTINSDIWDKINPENVSLENKKDVLDIISRYEALSDKDKKYIVGYDEVLAAKAKIEALEKVEVENKEEGKEDNSSYSEVVQTGDTSNFGYLFAVLILSGAVMIYSKKKEVKEA